MKKKLLISFIILNLYHQFAGAASVETITWKGIYYPGIPARNNISDEYCKNHTIGTFIHSVKNVLDQGITTDKGIRLDHATFHEEKKLGLYFLTGDILAHGKTGTTEWTDHIHYYFYKLTEEGLTQGVWSTNECKGFYTGVVLKTS